MVQEIQQGDIFGRIGKNLGQGLSETLPKAVERNTLADQLQKIEKKPNFSLSEAVRAVGPENVQSFTPLIREQQARNQEMEKRKAKVGKPELPVQTTEEDRKNPNYLLPKSRENIEALGVELWLDNPAKYPTRESGIAEAQKIDDSKVEREKAYEARQILTKTELKSSMEELLQKKGNEKYVDVSGGLGKLFEKKALKDVKDGKLSPEEAGVKYAEEALEFAKTRTNLKELGGFFSKRIAGAEEVRGKIDEIRKRYAALDQGEYFADDLIAYQNLTTPYANYLASPVKNNKEINNYISKLSNTIPFNPLSAEGRRGGKLREPGGSQLKGKSADESQIAEFISQPEVLKQDDSLLSIALALRGRGYDETKFLDAISKNPKISLNERQRHELEHKGKIRPNLNDAFFFSQAGLDKILEQP